MATIPGSAFTIDSHPGDILHGSDHGGSMFLHFANDTVYAGDGDMLIHSTGGNAGIELGGGYDVVFASGGDNYVQGGDGEAVITVGGHDNVVQGGAGDAIIYGGLGGDILAGGSGDDSIHAGSGAEFLSGGDGNNTLFAGKGDDTMVGGEGDNMFVFGSGGGKNVIVDFHDGDSIAIAKNINGLNITTPQDVVSHITDDNGNAVITLGHETITLLNIKADDIEHNPSGYFHIH